MEKIQITRADIDSISEIKKLIERGYEVNYKQDTPLSQPYFSDTYIADVGSGKIRLFVAERNGELVGSVQYENKDGIAFVSQMVVDSDFRNQGIGLSLLKSVEFSAKKEGFKKVQLTAMIEKGLPEYYEKQGYRAVGTKERQTYTLTIMEKELI